MSRRFLYFPSDVGFWVENVFSAHKQEFRCWAEKTFITLLSPHWITLKPWPNLWTRPHVAKICDETFAGTEKTSWNVRRCQLHQISLRNRRKAFEVLFQLFFCCTIRFCWQQRKQTLEIWKAAAPNKTLSYKFPNGKPAADRAAFSSNINLWLWLTHRAATRTTLCDLRELPSSKNQF